VVKYAKSLLWMEMMGASNDSSVVNKDRPDNRATWVRPLLRRIAANKAELGVNPTNEGHGVGTGSPQHS
jgi:hypothetical protein